MVSIFGEPRPARTLVMGVLNVTPDSFSDGGRWTSADRAAAHAEQMVAEGADLIDIGGESTRPGADEVDPQVEIRRTVPVIERILDLPVPISIDTRHAVVAKAALDAGAAVVNDVSAGLHDPGMLPLVADRGVPVILMHMRGTPGTMDTLTGYGDVVADVRSELGDRVRAAVQAGVGAGRIAVDPGLGFAKTPEQSLSLLRHVDDLSSAAADLIQSGVPLVVGPSRKRFIGHVLDAPVTQRLEGTLAAVAWCAIKGVAAVRVHDVQAARRTVEMIAAIRGA